MTSWIRLGDIGARAARSALSPAFIALATAARKRATYFAPRARSNAWRNDSDITRFLKALPNWNLLKNSRAKGQKETQVDLDVRFIYFIFFCQTCVYSELIYYLRM